MIAELSSSPNRPCPDWHQALLESGVLERLTDFDPRVAGTLPLGVSIASSDIDILCHASDPNDVGDVLWHCHDRLPLLSLRRWTSGVRPLIVNFAWGGWPVELFVSPVPVEQQEGWCHFVAEKRLLELGGEQLRSHVMALRQAGMKTEPAFAQVLGLRGDPYAALYALADVPDDVLCSVLASVGFTAS